MQQDSANPSPSRHNRWYERALLNPFLGHMIAILSLTAGAQFLSYQKWVADENQAYTLLWLLLTYLLSVILSHNIGKFTGGKAYSYTLATTAISGAIMVTAVLLMRLGYARTSLLVGLSLLVALQCASIAISRRFRRLKLAVIPSEDQQAIPDTRNVEFRLLPSPDLAGIRYDGIVVDMDQDLEDEWIRFVSHCNIAGIPVLPARQIEEAIRGKVNLATLQSTDLANLQPSPVYLAAKRATDILLTVAAAPLLLPLCMIMAILIRIDSPGSAIFVQQRIGKGNKVFKMYKFRSMKPSDNPADAPQFADQDAHRITRLGAFIRKFRIDELPQFLNVLLGDMSLIGPRPEQPGFVEKFESEVPYYSYRHIVRPGITGWAQVNQGYATDTDETREKVEHDFYYIKNLSLGLDFLVIMRTLKTVATGFGAM